MQEILTPNIAASCPPYCATAIPQLVSKCDYLTGQNNLEVCLTKILFQPEAWGKMKTGVTMYT